MQYLPSTIWYCWKGIYPGDNPSIWSLPKCFSVVEYRTQSKQILLLQKPSQKRKRRDHVIYLNKRLSCGDKATFSHSSKKENAISSKPPDDNVLAKHFGKWWSKEKWEVHINICHATQRGVSLAWMTWFQLEQQTLNRNVNYDQLETSFKISIPPKHPLILPLCSLTLLTLTSLTQSSLRI